MARDDVALRISKDRIGEAERGDGRPDLLDLTLGMCTGIARIGNEVSDRAVCNGQPRWEASRCWFVHEPEIKGVPLAWLRRQAGLDSYVTCSAV